MTRDCEIRVTSDDTGRLRDILDRAPEGAVICFEPGRYRHYFFLKKSVTLRGLGAGVVFRGDGAPNITVARPIHVTIENITLSLGMGGPDGTGGNLDVTDPHAEVLVKASTLTHGEAMASGGGAVGAHGGHVTLERCLVTDSQGRNADAVLATQYSRVTIIDSVIRGNDTDVPLIRAVAHGRIDVKRSSLLAGTRAAVLAVEGSDFVGFGAANIEGSVLSGSYRIVGNGNVELKDCLVSTPPPATAHSERVTSTTFAPDEHGRIQGRLDVGPTAGVHIGADYPAMECGRR